MDHTNGIKEKIVIACDFDRTLTDDSLSLSKDIVKKLAFMKELVGFILVIASGRRLLSLIKLLNGLIDSCDALIAENGAILYDPKKRMKIRLTSRIDALHKALRKSGIEAEFGEVIVSIRRSEYVRLLDILKQHNLDVDLIYNVDSLMVLPRGVNKGTGLKQYLKLIGINNAFIIAFGDGENDLDLFKVADVRIAVANATEELKREADFVSDLPDGKAVIDYISRKLI